MGYVARLSGGSTLKIIIKDCSQREGGARSIDAIDERIGNPPLADLQ